MEILAAHRLFASWEASGSCQEVHLSNFPSKGDRVTVLLEDNTFIISQVTLGKTAFKKTLPLHTPNTYAKINAILRSKGIPTIPKPVFVKGFKL